MNHPALQRLLDAENGLNEAENALRAARENRRRCAAGLAEITEDEERWQAVVLAYHEVKPGLTTILAQAATGLPGHKGQPDFLKRVGRRVVRSSGKRKTVAFLDETSKDWPVPDALERDLIRSHIEHRKPYDLRASLGWGVVVLTLQPEESTSYLADPTSLVAKKYGLKRVELTEYLTSEGCVMCEAHTAAGRPCKSRVAGVRGRLGIREWKAAKAHGGYCNVHRINAGV